MDTLSLKEYIYENNKVEYVLESIGCHSIKYHSSKEFYSCANYNGDNVGAVNIKNNKYLNVTNWTRKKEFGECSDIFDLVQYNKNCSFVESVKYLHKLLGLEYSPCKKKKNEEKKFDPLWIFKKIKMAKRKVDVADIDVLEEKVLDEYVPLLHIDWFRDGVMPWSRDKFGLMYSYRRKRVVIPHRHWLSGKLLGMNMRTTLPNYEELGIRKYILTEGMNKSINLYGLWENYQSIQEAGYVVIAESERSTLKRDSLGDSTVVSLSGKTISDEQVRIIIGLNVEVIIGLDKDLDINEIRHMCEKFYHIRPVSYIYDKWDLLKNKDAPMDVSNKIYQFLLKHRVKYDETEHNKYIESLKVMVE